jgi:hypothetical protein
MVPCAIHTAVSMAICTTGFMTSTVDILCGSSAYWERCTNCTVYSIGLSQGSQDRSGHVSYVHVISFENTKTLASSPTKVGGVEGEVCYSSVLTKSQSQFGDLVHSAGLLGERSCGRNIINALACLSHYLDAIMHAVE